MKDIIKKYYKLDDEIKEDLYVLNMFHEIESLLEEYEDTDIISIADEEKLLEVALACSVLTTLDASEIVKRLLEVLNCQDVSIIDFEELDASEILELITNTEDENTSEPIEVFINNGNLRIFTKQGERYIIAYQNGDKHKVLGFKDTEELIAKIIDNDILEDEKKDK